MLHKKTPITFKTYLNSLNWSYQKPKTDQKNNLIKLHKIRKELEKDNSKLTEFNALLQEFELPVNHPNLELNCQKRSKVLKVIVIDNSSTLHKLYQNLFEDFEEYELSGFYTSVLEAFNDFSNVRPDIVISEILLPHMNGIDGIKLFRQKKSNIKIIVVSSLDNVNYILDAFSNKVNGYISKLVVHKLLLDALNSATKEEIKVSSNILQNILSSFQKKKYDMLSKRENEIIDLLAHGNTYKTIASKLFVTTSTINFHIQNIYLKLNVNSKSKALAKLKRL